MIIFVCNNDTNGLLSALFVSFTEKILPCEIIDRNLYQPRFDCLIREIRTDTQSSERVKKALFNYAGDDIIAHLRLCLSSCDKRALTVAFNYAYRILSERKDISDNLSDRYVSDFSFIVQKVLHERHIVSGFLRFQESSNGVLYAQYTPDNDITSILAPHFLRRLGNIPFIIHDKKRNKIAISNGKAIKITQTTLPANFSLAENEKSVTELWKRYFKSINIEQRKNPKLQNGYFPRRYRHHAFETWET